MFPFSRKIVALYLADQLLPGFQMSLISKTGADHGHASNTS